MTDRDYSIKSMKEITFQMASHAQDYLEVTIERHYIDIKELMTSYQKLILEKADDVDFSPINSPNSRTVGGYPCSFE